MHRISYVTKSHNPSIDAEIDAQTRIYAAKTLWMPTLEFEGDPFLSQAYEKTSQQLIVTQPKSALSGESVNLSNSSLNEYNLFSLEQDISLICMLNGI